MEALALYLLKVHVGVSLLYGIYFLLLKNESYFHLNRFVLLAIVLISFTMPLFPGMLTGFGPDNSISSLSTTTEHIAFADIKGREVAKFDDEIPFKRLSGLITSLMSFYLCAVIFFLFKFIGHISDVMALIRKSEKVHGGDTIFVDPGESVPAFSFFSHIVVNRDQHEHDQLKQVIAHERAHVVQLHSFDIIIAELASVLLWGNPLVKHLKETIRMNLEFLADQYVLKAGFDKKAYQWSLVAPYLQQHRFPLTNLYSSKPKQRIERMNATRRPIINIFKYLMIIPVLVLFYTVVAPYQASALNKIKAMKLIDDHQYQDYLGYYEFDRDKGSFVLIMMKDDQLIMNTLWNNKKIYFQKRSENTFINNEGFISLAFPRNFEGAVKGFVAFGDDQWTKVQKYKPIVKRSGEGTVISRTAGGGMQVLVYAIEPWAYVKHYSLNNTAESP
jgi:hypothetical protein